MNQQNTKVKRIEDIKLDKLPDKVAYIRTGLFLLWKYMVFSYSEEDYNKAWDII